MNRFVPLDKQSKSARRAHYAAQRKSWGQINPAGHVVSDKRHANRKQLKTMLRHEASLQREVFNFGS